MKAWMSPTKRSHPGYVSPGGTSIGSLATKPLPHLYMGLRFLEHVGSPELSARYLPRYAPFGSAAELRQQLTLTPEVMAMLAGLDSILNRLVREPGNA